MKGFDIIKKLFTLIIIILMTLTCSYTYCFATNNFDLGEFSSEVKKYGGELFPELEDTSILDGLMSGKVDISAKNIFERILNAFLGEFRESIFLIFKILGIAIFCGILKNIQNSFGESRS